MGALAVLLLIVVVLFVAGAVLGAIGNLLGYLVIGLVIGALARLFVSGTGGMGLLRTILAGVAGSLGGGIAAEALDLEGLMTFVVSVIVAAVAVALLRPREEAV